MLKLDTVRKKKRNRAKHQEPRVTVCEKRELVESTRLFVIRQS